MLNNHLTINSIFDYFIRELCEKRVARYYVFKGYNNVEYVISPSDNLDFNFMDKIRIMFNPEFVEGAIYSLLSTDKINKDASSQYDLKDPKTTLQSYWCAMLDGNTFYSNKTQTIYLERLLETIKSIDKEKSIEVMEKNGEYLAEVFINSIFNNYAIDELPVINKRFVLDDEIKKKEKDIPDSIDKEFHRIWREKRSENIETYLVDLRNIFRSNKYFNREITDLSIDINKVFTSKLKVKDDEYYKEIFRKVAKLVNILIFNSILNIKDIDVVKEKLFYRTELYEYIAKSDIHATNYQFGFSYIKDRNVNRLENTRIFNPEYQCTNLALMEDFLFKDLNCIYSIHGNAGIGKSELINYFLRSHIDNSGQIVINDAKIDHVLKLECKSENNSSDMLKSLIADLYLTDNRSNNLDKLFLDNLETLKKQYGKRLLLVIDNYKNFNYFKDDFNEDSEVFKKLIDANINILIISNVDLKKANNKRVKSLDVSNIANRDLFDLFCKITRIHNDHDDIKAMIENDFLNNTYSVVLIANLIKVSLKDEDEEKRMELVYRILKSLKSNGANDEYTKRKLEKQRDIYEQFVHILSKYEPLLIVGNRWYVLMNATVIPESGIEKNIFLEMISKGNENYSKDIDFLVELSFLKIKMVGNIEYITIHQLLRNAVITVIRKNSHLASKYSKKVAQAKKGELLKYDENAFTSIVNYLVANKNTYYYDGNSDSMRVISSNIYEVVIPFFVKKDEKTNEYVTRTAVPKMCELKIGYAVIMYDAMINNDDITSEHAYIAALLVKKMPSKYINKEDTFIYAKICNEISVDLYNSSKLRDEKLFTMCSLINSKGIAVLENYKNNPKVFDESEYLRRKGYDLECLLEGNLYTFSNLSPIQKIEGYIGVQNKRKRYIDNKLMGEMSYINGMYVVSNKYMAKYLEDKLNNSEDDEDLIKSFAYINRFIDESEDEKYDEINMFLTGRNQFLKLTSMIFDSDKFKDRIDDVLKNNNLTLDKLVKRVIRNITICLEYYKNVLIRVGDFKDTFEHIDSIMSNDKLKENITVIDLERIEALKKEVINSANNTNREINV